MPCCEGTFRMVDDPMRSQERADDESVSLDANGDPVRIPLAGIRRSNLIPELRGGV